MPRRPVPPDSPDPADADAAWPWDPDAFADPGDPAGGAAAPGAAPAGSPDPPYQWVCETCGWTTGIYGRTKGEFGRALHHAYKDGKQKRADGKHTIRGLYDRATGELVVPFSSSQYDRFFGLGRAADGEPGRADPPVPAAPDDATRPPGAAPAKGGGRGGKTGRGGGSAGGGLPGRKLRVLAQDVDISDLVTVAFHLVSRRLPELLPPALLATEAGYAQALGRFLEDAVVVLLDQLTQTWPDRFTPADLNLALLAQAAADRITQLEAI
jgi:hypothetical protein